MAARMAEAKTTAPRSCCPIGSAATMACCSASDSGFDSLPIAEYSAIRVNCLVLTNDSISRAALVAALMAAASQGLAQNPVTYVVVDAHADRHPINPDIYGLAFAATS